MRERLNVSVAVLAFGCLKVSGRKNQIAEVALLQPSIAWGIDLMFLPAQMKNQNADILKLKTWMTPAEALWRGPAIPPGSRRSTVPRAAYRSVGATRRLDACSKA